MKKLSDFGLSKSLPEADLPPLVFFDTRKQQTRLVTNRGRPFIELEDKDTGEVKRYRVEEHTIKVHADYKDRTGRVDIGQRKNWLYSKRLFLDGEDLVAQIALRLDRES